MIGDRDLELVEESSSTEWLRTLVWNTADEAGAGKHFPAMPMAVGDDHKPFLDQGVAALDLIDFDYGPNNSYWHTNKDTMDKLSADSFQVMGKVLLRVIPKLEKQ